MKKSQYISALKAQDQVSSPFLIKYLAVARGKDGKSYLNLILADSSGEMESRKWQEAEQIAETVKAGDIVNIEGKMNAFQGRLQLIVTTLVKNQDPELSMEDFIKKGSTAPELMYEELLAHVQPLKEIYLRDLLLAVLNDYEIKRRLMLWQAGKSVHHAYQSGLLEHVLSCTKLGKILSVHYNVNESYVIAGCILHDLCKIYELSDGPVVEYTEEGKLIGHLVKSLEVVDYFAQKIPNFPYAQKMHLKHILLSHHGEYEYGSPKIPLTMEAYLVHLIDLMDSKMNAMEQAKKNDNNTGHWSQMIKHLDRSVFKNDLPSFTSVEITENHLEQTKETVAKTPARSNEPLKQSLASKLGGFKID